MERHDYAFIQDFIVWDEGRQWVYPSACLPPSPTRQVQATGVATGGYMGIYTPKISPSKLFMG